MPVTIAARRDGCAGVVSPERAASGDRAKPPSRQEGRVARRSRYMLSGGVARHLGTGAGRPHRPTSWRLGDLARPFNRLPASASDPARCCGGWGDCLAAADALADWLERVSRRGAGIAEDVALATTSIRGGLLWVAVRQYGLHPSVTGFRAAPSAGRT